MTEHNKFCMKHKSSCICNTCKNDHDLCCTEHIGRVTRCRKMKICPDYEPDTDTTMIEKQEELK